MNALLQWHAPTHYTNGQPIRVPLTYTVYQFRERSVTAPLFPIVTGVVDTFFTVRNLPSHSSVCFAVRAVTPTNERSQISSIVCRRV